MLGDGGAGEPVVQYGAPKHGSQLQFSIWLTVQALHLPALFLVQGGHDACA
jgi:hypothetical protein